MVARAMRTQWWSSSRIKAYQAAKLQHILDHASRSIPYYRESLLPRNEEDSKALLAQFPIMDKAQLQSCPDQFVWGDLPANKTHRSRSSGSTGEPLTTVFDHNAWLLVKYALKARRVLNATRSLNQRLVVISETEDNTRETLENVKLADWIFSTMTMSVTTEVEQNSAALLAYTPTMLYGYPSYLAYLAESISRSGQEAPAIPTIFTSSEVLTPFERRNLEAAYQGRVTDVYGSTEFKEIAVQCQEGRYHVNFESVYVETLEESGPPRVLITSLVNHAMPMIRFDIGDHAELAEGDCDCGRSGPYLQHLHGRSSEILRFPDGSAVTSFTLTTVVGSYPEIKNYSIIQEAPERVRILVYADPELGVDRRAMLIQDIAAKLPPGVDISIERLQHRLPSGKRVAVSRAF